MMKKDLLRKNEQRARRVARTRAKISGTPTQPRLAIFRGLRTLSAQLIDDTTGTTLVAVNQHEAKAKSRTEIAQELGALIAKKAKEKGVDQAVFDRRHYKYHGRVKTFADAAREAGLQF